ncbi:unnamed protein product [Periconia digitata]|uniref:Cupin type-2 domain-containing protein n=1 Tax=Periconia digitata TaxID=1303443 RepID=A0A9W4U485_9PLEO|nr:unnamed protein product [Periconia digitata]
MSNPRNPQPPSTLRPTTRLITTHDPKTAKATFLHSSAAAPTHNLPTGDTLSLLYATHTFPSTPTTDLTTYLTTHLSTSPTALPLSFKIENGTALYQIDFAPGSVAPFHRTRSLDYCVVVEGTVELVLEGEKGERKTVKKGDVVVLRGGRHSWKNVGEGGEWARIVFVLLDAEAVVCEGVELGEDFGGMGGDGAEV